MKHYLPLLTFTITFAFANVLFAQQASITGTITSPEGQPIPGVNIVEKGTANGVITDIDGNYRITVSSEDATLTFSFIGYKTEEVSVAGQTTLDLVMEEDLQQLNAVEVYSTGYQQLPAERATGSFTQVDQQLIQRSTGTDIISRLESVTPGLLFDKRDAGKSLGMDHRNLRIRGVNSIESDNSPLIVVNSFPYEGDLNSINPNDVESITVLKDAAAASIWGARAANGVIVITLKSGDKNQPLSVSLNSNVTLGEQPNIHYAPDFIPSPQFIELERELFSRGYYASSENSPSHPALSPVVELLIQQRDGFISSDELEARLALLGQNDVREEVEKYFYQKSLKQQHAINISGGTDKSQHYVSTGFDKNLSNIDGDQLQRITLIANNTLSPVKPLQLSLGINLTLQDQENNGIQWGDIGTDLPYNRFADQSGNWMEVTNTLRSDYINETAENGLLDWNYRPLQEAQLNNYETTTREYRIDPGISYDISSHWQLNLKYQFQYMATSFENLRDKDSYYVRNLVNRFTQQDGTRIFPYGDILTNRLTEQQAHSARVQGSYNRKFGSQHTVSALAGMEVRQVNAHTQGSQLYGYDPDILTYSGRLDYSTRYPVLPRGTAYIPQPSSYLSEYTDRYLSYFANASYTFKNRYTLSGSTRYDASNLFGVKTNQKGVPLWSLGASWTISDEAFFSMPMLSYLRLRTTYGYNGNINKSVTAFPTAAYSTDWFSGLSKLSLRTPGNPQLRWEKVSIMNAGVDFASHRDRISGSFEYFIKHGSDIIGERPVDPTTGASLSVNRVNYAETLTSGFDFQLTSVNIDQSLKWTTNIFVSYAKNKILEFSDESISNSLIQAGLVINSSVLPQKNKPIDGLYSLPWRGLNPDNGDPLVNVDGELVKDYREYVQSLTFDSLVYHGSSVAPLFGSVRNNLSWQNWSLSFNVSWKSGYYFRRSGVNYYNLFRSSQMHRDFLDRWMQHGDEAFTDIPSMPEEADSYRDYIYNASEILVEKGDHIRFEDINLSYSMSKTDQPWLPIKELRIFLYARNLGILWQASKSGLDPDYPNASYRTPRTYSVGLNAAF
ncbi:MAG: SusC/RagA family TonB-linked outer membrane protein [Marinoscillum sp.]